MEITEILNEKLLLSHKGVIAEQFVGQQLLGRGDFYQEPELYYWNREERSSSAELDYLIPMGLGVLPIEVKSGSTGSLKSLHRFVVEKKSPAALRFNLERPLVAELCSNSLPGQSHPFRLISLPLYLVSQAERLCRS